LALLCVDILPSICPVGAGDDDYCVYIGDYI
jgi:hypothetical protein